MNSKLNRVLENLKNIATLKDYFNDYLNLFFKGNLENLHNIFSIDNVGDSIEEISRQETCAFFYNSIKGSKGFKYRNDDHKKFDQVCAIHAQLYIDHLISYSSSPGLQRK